MKNTPLSELRKKSLQYFRKIGIVRGDGRRKKAIEYIVQKSYEALPKNIKKYIEDAEQIRTKVYNLIMAEGKSGEVEPYNALKQYAMDRKKKSGDNTKEYIYKRESFEKLLTTLLPTLNSLKQSNLDEKILTTMLLPLTTSYYLVRIRVFYI